jgi:hypothetical protein
MNQKTISGLTGDLHEDLRDFPLHLAACYGKLRSQDTANSLDAWRHLVNCKDHWGDTPILKCCMAGHIESLRTLVQMGADALCTNEALILTTLHFLFMFHGQEAEEAASLLQQAGAIFEQDVHTCAVKAFHFPFAWPSGGPLHWAVFANNVSAVRALLKRGAPIDEKDGSGQAPLHIAMKMLNSDLVQQLLDSGAELHTLDDSDSFSPQKTPAHDFLWTELDLGGDPAMEDYDGMEAKIPYEYSHFIMSNNVRLEKAQATLNVLMSHVPDVLSWKDANSFPPCIILHHTVLPWVSQCT